MTSPTSFEPTLALIERRLAALHQEQGPKFRCSDPWWVLFSPEEIQMLFLKEPADARG